MDTQNLVGMENDYLTETVRIVVAKHPHRLEYPLELSEPQPGASYATLPHPETEVEGFPFTETEEIEYFFNEQEKIDIDNLNFNIINFRAFLQHLLILIPQKSAMLIVPKT